MVKDWGKSSRGCGCLIVLMGIALGVLGLAFYLVGALVGVVVVLVGACFCGKGEPLWRCKTCQATFPRKRGFLD